MGGGFSASGLVSGIDTHGLIQQLMQLERKPLQRLEARKERLEAQQSSLRDFRTMLQDFQSIARGFRFGEAFNQFSATSTESIVADATVGGETPVTGTFEVEVLQRATATIATSSGNLGGSIDAGAALADSGIRQRVTAGEFTINGQVIEVDPDTDSLDDVLNAINNSGAGVTAAYDASTDRVTISNNGGGSGVINLGGNGDSSNFLNAIQVADASQSNGEIKSTRTLGSVNPNMLLENINFEGGAAVAGTFTINGVAIDVDPEADTLQTVLNRINASDAKVTASYDAINDAIRVESDILGSPTINFGGDTGNFLALTKLDNAVQTPGQNARFTIDNGAVQERATNNVDDVIDGVTLNLKSSGKTTVAVGRDEEAVVDEMKSFVEAFNKMATEVRELTGREGTLANDSAVRAVENQLRRVFSDVIEGAGGDARRLADLGVSIGRNFDAGSTPTFNFDEDAFLEAFRADPTGVQNLLSNTDRTGVADKTLSYLNDIVSTRGFLHQRANASTGITGQIRGVEDQMQRTEGRLAQREKRLRAQFANMERLISNFQGQSASLGRIGMGASMF